MKCPKCNCNHSKVTDTRIALDQKSIRRRRKCSACGYKFSTTEVYCKMELVVKKRDGREEDFDAEKIMRGLQKAVKLNGVNERKIEVIMQNILQKIRDHHSQKISTEDVGQIVMEELKKTDPMAYLRFASICKKFHAAHEFEQEVRNLEQIEGVGHESISLSN